MTAFKLLYQFHECKIIYNFKIQIKVVIYILSRQSDRTKNEE